MQTIAQQLFIGLLVELISLLLAYVFSVRRKVAITILAIGTVFAGLIAFYPISFPPLPTPEPPVSSEEPTTSMIYDDFNDPQFDGSYNSTKWTINNIGDITQRNGILNITINGQSGTHASLLAREYYDFSITSPMFFEAQLMVEEPQSGHVYLYLGSDLPSGEYSDCTLGYGEAFALVNCGYESNGKTENRVGDKPVNFGTWHQVRIEVDPIPMTMNYYIDGQKVEEFQPRNSEQLKNSRFTLEIGFYRTVTETFIGYIDEVKIGLMKK